MPSARQIAFDILCKVHEGRHTLDQWLESAEPQLQHLNKADRALVHAIVLGTLRWQGRLDFIIDHLAKSPARIDGRTRIILRLALFQLCHMDRIPASAAVHTAVDLAKKNRRHGSAGFINAVLRKATAGGEQTPWPDPIKASHLALAARQAFPPWLTARWIQRWGWEEAAALCKAINTIPGLTLRVNTLKTDRPTLMAAIGNDARQVAPTRYTPEGIALTTPARPIAQWDTFQQGWFQVQDEAAQLVSHCLAPEPGATVWDACAGLGTKTAHLAQLMGNKGKIMATDVNQAKLTRLDDEMQRLGVSIVSTRQMELKDSSAVADLPLFDHILVDAPCSGLGVLQKNPDGKWQVTAETIHRCHQRQVVLLENAAPHLRPGGTMVYAVCSFEPEENEAVVKAFLQKHPDFAIYLPRLTAVAQPAALLTPQGWLSTIPHQHGIDGFFAAAFIKQ